MNTKRQHIVRALLLTGALALTVPQAALALTPACTQINNRATVTYDVGGITQTPIDSKNGNNGNADEATSFYVGVKVDVVVTKKDASIVSVAPGLTTATLTYNVANIGNATMKYALTASNKVNGIANPFALPAAAVDNFDGTINFTNGTAGSTSTIASLAPGVAGQDVTVIVTIPNTQVNNDLSVFLLKAQSQLVGDGSDVNAKNINTKTGANIGGATCTAAGPATATIDIVAADGAGTAGDGDNANDGASSARDAFLVSAAGLTITKSSAVYWDPVNLFVSPKAIPGAVITYTVSIANAAGGANATNVKVIDDLASAITNGVTFGNGSTDAGQTDTNYNDGTTSCLGGGARGIVVDGVCKSNANDADFTSWNQAADPNGGTNKVGASNITVNAGSTSTVKYQVTIQ
jgi:hypothetical protein